MAYAAVRGGRRAIQEANRLLDYYRLKGGSVPIEVRQIRDQMRLAVDQVMGEGSLYDPDLAALALKQAEGDTLEAAFLLRAFRSTVPRNQYSLAVDTSRMRVIRRISAAFKDVPGGQFLGPTRDYTQRLLRFELMEETEERAREFLKKYVEGDEWKELEAQGPLDFPKMIDWLRAKGLLENPDAAEGQREPGPIDDITRRSISFPASRSMRMQALARGETGALLAFAYSVARGYGAIHPTLGELRVGYVPVLVPHPLHSGEVITIGEVLVTEAEVVARMRERTDQLEAKFSLGYGLCFGHNEIKAIAMAALDRAMVSENPQAPAEDEEFVLYHIDGIESSGFVAHWKLPHYVDFQAEMIRVRSIQRQRGPRA
ncbi:carbon-phosphorus lyase complex subunit PhnI [Kyrpidia sp.]|uniref:carbon-phosphorus lyase complex subunit PhnI n=1 Tax=Kyrpidia sp. TaxID=2073077 RepID=UPI00258A89EA|nr:carbon-phosphorus lyase complex subunit PhnI [Kyrpidia sp.]MCL6576930.1 carbon-phosphorus lyase complex subunit PhnI [Kyrpidia sp.]